MESENKEFVRTVDTEIISGEYILNNRSDDSDKQIIFSNIIWYDKKKKKYGFKSESNFTGKLLSANVVAYKLAQDMRSIQSWILDQFGSGHIKKKDGKK